MFVSLGTFSLCLLIGVIAERYYTVYSGVDVEGVVKVLNNKADKQEPPKREPISEIQRLTNEVRRLNYRIEHHPEDDEDSGRFIGVGY